MNRMAEKLRIVTIFIICICYIVYNILDIVFTYNCYNYLFNYSAPSDQDQLGQFEKLICFIG